MNKLTAIVNGKLLTNHLDVLWVREVFTLLFDKAPKGESMCFRKGNIKFIESYHYDFVISLDTIFNSLYILCDNGEYNNTILMQLKHDDELVKTFNSIYQKGV